MKNIRWATALGENDTLEHVAFSESLKFQIVEFDMKTKNVSVITQVANPSFGINDLEKKAKALFDFLKEQDVKFLAARQFGLLINQANKKYVPVIVETERPEEVSLLLSKHISWLLDELSSSKNEFMMFKIGHGIMKYKLN